VLSISSWILIDAHGLESCRLFVTNYVDTKTGPQSNSAVEPVGIVNRPKRPSNRFSHLLIGWQPRDQIANYSNISGGHVISTKKAGCLWYCTMRNVVQVDGLRVYGTLVHGNDHGVFTSRELVEVTIIRTTIFGFIYLAY
jgi:hypothetical protein